MALALERIQATDEKVIQFPSANTNYWNFVTDIGDDGYAIVARKIPPKFNYADANGKLLSDKWFSRAKEMKSGFAPVKDGDEWKYITSKGQLIYGKFFSFTQAWPLENGVLLVKMNDHFYFLHRKYLKDDGENNQYCAISNMIGNFCDEIVKVSDCSNGAFWVVKRSDGKENYCDRYGNLLSHTWFAKAHPMSEEFIAKTEDERGSVTHYKHNGCCLVKI